MEFQPIEKTAIFELPYFAQESILVAQKACEFDGPYPFDISLSQANDLC